MATKRKAAKQKEQPARYFIVNPAGAIHEVNQAHAQQRLRQPGWRQATTAEVKELLYARGGNQRFDDPICDPWNPAPQPIEGLDGLDLSALTEEEGEGKKDESPEPAV